MQDSREACSTSEDACSTLESNLQELTQDEVTEIENEDKAKAGGTNSKGVEFAKLDSLNGDKSGLAPFQTKGSNSDEAAISKTMPGMVMEASSNLTSKLRGVLAEELAKEMQQM